MSVFWYFFTLCSQRGGVSLRSSVTRVLSSVLTPESRADLSKCLARLSAGHAPLLLGPNRRELGGGGKRGSGVAFNAATVMTEKWLVICTSLSGICPEDAGCCVVSDQVPVWPLPRPDHPVRLDADFRFNSCWGSFLCLSFCSSALGPSIPFGTLFSDTRSVFFSWGGRSAFMPIER